jgi:hypothetical protein
MNIIGIKGLKRHGKDTAAEAFVKHHGFVKVGFADAVKRAALALDPIIVAGPFPSRLSEVVDTLGWEDAKEVAEVRRILQHLGTEVVRETVHQNGWLMAWQKTVDELFEEPEGIVVPDVRFINEAEYLRSKGATIIQVVRPDLPASGDLHASETEQEAIQADLTVVNEGSVEQFHRRLLGAYYLGRPS